MHTNPKLYELGCYVYRSCYAYFPITRPRRFLGLANWYGSMIKMNRVKAKFHYASWFGAVRSWNLAYHL